MTEVEQTGAVTQAELVAFITAATAGVFSTMLGLEIRGGEPFREKAATASASGVVSLVDLAGSWMGTGSISCSATLACRLCSALLMADYDSIDEEVLDAVAEITNMIIGNVKTSIEERLGPMGLSTPTVIFGRNFQTRNAGNHEWIVVPFEAAGEMMHVQLYLAPSRDAGQKPVRPGFPIPHLLNV